MTLANRIIELWAEPLKSGEWHYSPKPGIGVDDIRATLSAEFGPELLQTELKRLLLEHGEREREQHSHSPEELYLPSRIFELLGPPSRRLLERRTVERLVCLLPSIGYDRELGPWVTEYLDEAALLGALAGSIYACETPFARLVCIHNAGGYLPYARPSTPPARSVALGNFECAFRPLTEDTEPLLSEAVDVALKLSWRLRKEWRIGSTAKTADFTAYRVDGGTEQSYQLELPGTSRPALEISKFHVSDDVAFVDYKNNEPSLLPADVPAVIGTTLLPAFVSAGQIGRIHVLQCHDIRLKHTWAWHRS